MAEIDEIRAGVRTRLAQAAVAGGGVLAQPRYDDVFVAGVEWLDQLGGEPLAETEGKLTIGQDVWKSDARRQALSGDVVSLDQPAGDGPFTKQTIG